MRHLRPISGRRARLLLALAASGAALHGAGAQPAASFPRTRAERTEYRETSSHADVLAFLDSLQRLGAPIRVGVMARSPAGREVPYVIAARPLVTTPAEARRTGRPVVYVQGNIHAGEVEGKEALQALLRDLVASPRPNVLDSVVLVAVPIYNADGNEKLAPQARNRSEQNGPGLVGERANGQGLDLNRDYVKAEAPETRGALALLAAWDPDVFVDLHTTDGSYHGYALTYSPPLGLADLPGLRAGAEYARDSLLPELRRRVRRRRGFATFDYGNFPREFGTEANADTTRQGWYTYDHRPRFGTNYVGLRGRIGILSEAYSHDPFERRVRATDAFVRELLSLVAERGPRLVARGRASDALLARWGAGATDAPALPVRYELTRTPHVGPVIAEDLARATPGEPAEPGVMAGYRRTGRFRTVRLPIYDRFTPTLRRALPRAWALAAGDTAAVAALRRHGVVVERLTAEWVAAPVEAFAVDSLAVSPRQFQGHREVRLGGRWRSDRRALPAGTYLVPADQPLGALALWLLDPESDDGLATWNWFDGTATKGGEFPVLRVTGAVKAARRAVQ
jgi:hypothetical protein